MNFRLPLPPKKSRQENTRPKRWMRAVGNGLYAVQFLSEAMPEEMNDRTTELDDTFPARFPEIEDAEKAFFAIEEARQELEDLQGEYKEWYDNMNENLQGSATGELLSAIADLEIPDMERSSLDDMEEFFNTADGCDLPRGYGKD